MQHVHVACGTGAGAYESGAWAVLQLEPAPLLNTFRFRISFGHPADLASRGCPRSTRGPRGFQAPFTLPASVAGPHHARRPEGLICADVIPSGAATPLNLPAPATRGAPRLPHTVRPSPRPRTRIGRYSRRGRPAVRGPPRAKPSPSPAFGATRVTSAQRPPPPRVPASAWRCTRTRRPRPPCASPAVQVHATVARFGSRVPTTRLNSILERERSTSGVGGPGTPRTRCTVLGPRSAWRARGRHRRADAVSAGPKLGAAGLGAQPPRATPHAPPVLAEWFRPFPSPKPKSPSHLLDAPRLASRCVIVTCSINGVGGPRGPPWAQHFGMFHG